MTFLCGDLNIFSPQDYYFGTVFCTVTCIFEKVPTYCVMTWSCHNRCDTNLTQGENIKQLGYQNVVAKNRIFKRELNRASSSHLFLVDLSYSK